MAHHLDQLRQEAHRTASVACEAVAQLHQVLQDLVRALDGHVGAKEPLGLVCIDPGHGGHDTGAVDATGRVREKDLVLDYALEVREVLEGMGFVCMMTRTVDAFVPLSKRADLANEAGALCFVSIHANAADSTLANGAWIIHDDTTRDEDGKALAMSVFKAMEAVPGVADQDPEAEVYADGTPWVGGRQLTVVSRTKMPAILVELGFMTNEEDLSSLMSPATKGAVCRAVALGVMGWWANREVPGGST